MNARVDHLSIATLLDYWLHDSDADTTDAVDEHLLQCDACGQAFDELIALGEGVRSAFRAGAVAAVTSGTFVEQLAAQGLKVREYRVPHNGGVDCTVAPDDDLLVAYLEAPLHGVQRLDFRVQLSFEPDEHRLDDVPFDPQSGEVLYAPKLAELKTLPAHTQAVTLLAVEPGGGTRELGRYTFRHRPWPGH